MLVPTVYFNIFLLFVYVYLHQNTKQKYSCTCILKRSIYFHDMQTQTKKIIFSLLIVTVMAGPAFLGGGYLQTALIPSQSSSTTLYSSPENTNTTSTGTILGNQESPTYCPPTCITPYIPEDISEMHPARYALMLLLAAHILPISKDHMILPEQTVSRGEISEIVAKTFSISRIEETMFSPFKDISDQDEFYESVIAMYQHKFLNGYFDHTFRADTSISKAEAVKLLASAKFSPAEIEEAFTSWKTLHPTYKYVYFTDVSVDNWYAPYVQMLLSQNILKDNSTTFNAGNTVTKGELAILIANMIQKYDLQYRN